MSKLSKDDIHFIMETVMLEVSIEEELELSDLFILHKEKASYIVRRSTGRGIACKLHSEC